MLVLWRHPIRKLWLTTHKVFNTLLTAFRLFCTLRVQCILGHRKGGEWGRSPPLDSGFWHLPMQFLTKKGCFSFGVDKSKFHHFALPWKNPSLVKILPTPMSVSTIFQLCIHYRNCWQIQEGKQRKALTVKIRQTSCKWWSIVKYSSWNNRNVTNNTTSAAKIFTENQTRLLFWPQCQY